MYTRKKLSQLFEELRAAHFWPEWCDVVDGRKVMPDPKRVYRIALQSQPATTEQEKAKKAVLNYVRLHAPFLQN